jgi:hypothetical protein
MRRPAAQLSFIPQGHSFQYPLEGYEFRMSRQAAQLSFNVGGFGCQRLFMDHHFLMGIKRNEHA